jgi:2'-5' RNA ligase
MENSRIQLTLFPVNPPPILESVRAQLNPVQHSLIAAHVTLCREDELHDLTIIKANLSNIKLAQPLRIAFDGIKRFSEDKGLLLAAKSPTLLDHLRSTILAGIFIHPRPIYPHLTLIHPRNGSCTDTIFEELSKQQFPSYLDFEKISLIRQIDGEEWKVLEEFPLVKG